VRVIAISGGHVATHDGAGALHTWSVDTGAEVAVIDEPIEDVVPSVMYGAFDVLRPGAIETWTATGERDVRVQLPDDVDGTRLSVDPAGGYLVAATDRHWRIDRDGRVSSPISHLTTESWWRAALAGGTIAIPATHSVQVNGRVHLPARDCARIKAVAVAPDGRSILVADDVPTLSLWSRDGRLLAAIEPAIARYDIGMAATLAGDLAVVSRNGGGLLVWNLARREIALMPMDGLRLHDLTVTEDGWLAADGGAHTRFRIGLWDLVALDAQRDAIPARHLRFTTPDKPCPEHRW
jgi:hypothetical protein